MDFSSPCPSCGVPVGPTALRCPTCGERTLGAATGPSPPLHPTLAGAGAWVPDPSRRRLDRGLSVALEPGFVTRRGHFGLHHVRSHTGQADLRRVEVRSHDVLRDGPFELRIEVPGYCAPWSVPVPDVRRLTPAVFEDVRLNWLWDEARTPQEADPSATLSVRLLERGGVVFEETHPVDVLAWNEWIPQLADRPDVLAAYVQPNRPSLAPLLKAAGGHLRAAEGSDALCGYQMGERRWVEAMVGAIHEALSKDSGVSYCNPPASFELGQKILLGHDVLAQGLGTCLDLTLLQCALLERVGLHPVVIVVRGHALPAVWTREDAALEDGADLAGALESGLLAFNSTNFCEGGSFASARASAARILASVPVLAAVDVRLARARGARPLP